VYSGSQMNIKFLINLKETLIEKVLLGCGLLTVLTTVGIIYVLFSESIGFFKEVSLIRFLTDTQWTPLFTQKHYGILPLMGGTFLTTVIALGVAVPAGLISAVYLSEYASSKTRQIVKPILEVLAAVPTVVYGYFALIFVTPLLKNIIPGISSFNALSAGLVMGVMIIPLVSSLSEDAMRAVPFSLREGAYALGSRKIQVAWRIVLGDHDCRYRGRPTAQIQPQSAGSHRDGYRLHCADQSGGHAARDIGI